MSPTPAAPPEPYLDGHGQLISHEAWRAFLESLERLLPLSKRSQESIITELCELLERAVKRRVLRHRHGALLRVPRQGGVVALEQVGVLFSGGIDSVLIAALLQRLGVPFACFTAGFRDGNAKEPEDLIWAERVAAELGFPLKKIVFNMENIELVFRQTVQLLSNGRAEVNVVNVGVGAVEVAAITRGKERGITTFFTGLGAEELFGGYDRHEQALERGGDAALHEECLRGLANDLYARDLRRDTALASALGVTLATPFLDEELIRFALVIPAALKINDDATYTGRKRGDEPTTRRYKKVILRAAAEWFGIPHDIAWRPKRAAQYGSRFNNALTKLRKAHGCRDKDEYLSSLRAS